MKGTVAIIALFSIIHPCLADTASAFSDGKSWGQDKKTSSFNDFQGKADSKTIPGYGSDASTQRGYYSNGKGQLFGFGASKITTCASGPANTDNFSRQDCEAVNFVAKQPKQRPTYTLNKDDPMIKKATANAADPNKTLDSIGWNPTTQGAGYSNCTTTTKETVPAKYSTEVCNEYTTPEVKACTIGQVVNVDADANFQCNNTVNAYEAKTCNKIAIVTVSQTGGSTLLCQPGSAVLTPDENYNRNFFNTWGVVCGTATLTYQGEYPPAASDYCGQNCYQWQEGLAWDEMNYFVSDHQIRSEATADPCVVELKYYTLSPNAGYTWQIQKTASIRSCVVSPTMKVDWDNQCGLLEERAK